MCGKNNGDSRRSIIKKGALATGALVLGTGASAGTATAQGDERVLIFSDDFHPDQDFEVLSELQQSTVIDVLQVNGETIDEISSPDDWDGYVIRYNMETNNSAGPTTFLFTPYSMNLSEGDTESLTGDAQMYSSDLNLLLTALE